MCYNITPDLLTRPVIFIWEGISVEHTDSRTIAMKSAASVMDECKAAAKEQLLVDPQSALSILESLGTCVEKGVAGEIEKARGRYHSRPTFGRPWRT